MCTYLTTERVALNCVHTSPEAAIRASGNLLVATGAADPAYVAAMVNAYKTLGPYIAIAPRIAMPHARPSQGGLRDAVSVIRLKNPIPFGHPSHDPIELVIGLVGGNDGEHLNILRYVANTVKSPASRAALKDAKTAGEVIQIFNYSN